MKNKTKIAVTVTLAAITSLMITAYHTQQPTPPVSPQIALVSEVVAVGRAYTPPTTTKPLVAEEIAKNGTQIEKITDPTNQQEDVANAEETPPTQPTAKDESTNTPAPPTQSPTKGNDTKSTTPSNGDTRVINGQQQGYLIGFGWVDHMGENTCTTDYGMYENGNKVGIMGDINKMIGSMD